MLFCASLEKKKSHFSFFFEMISSDGWRCQKEKNKCPFCKIHAAFTLAFAVLKSVLNNS